MRPVDDFSSDSISESTRPDEDLVPIEVVEMLESQLAATKQENAALTQAVYNSEEMILELEQTRIQLAAAQKEAELAHQNTQRLAETIFERSQEAMLVLDYEFNLVSANPKAREIFELELAEHGAANQHSLKEHLCRLYGSGDQLDWFKVLLDDPTGDKRIEIFRHLGDLFTAPFSIGREWIEVSLCVLDEGFDRSGYLLTARDVTQRKHIEDEIQYQALHDNVTQLPNRRYFIRQVEHHLLDPDSSEFAICFLDLDDFKSVNDRLGHEAGDQLLAQVSERIRNKTRNDCFLARFGGDEFALLVPNMSPANVAKIGRRIVQELKKPFTINRRTVHIGASVGMTRYPDDAQDVHSLLQNADVAMYSAKESGRNQFHLFTPELAAGIEERQSLLDDLRVALESKQLDLEYQPKWCLYENRVTGCEALLRWKRNGQPVSPLKIIEVAEGSGLILELGDLVVEQAFRQISQWRERGQFDGTVAINISGDQLVDTMFIQRFMNLSQEMQVPTEWIELEITETAMMKNFNRASVQISLLQKAGASIAIDDFGTGYSSLSYLKSFPVSTLKLDRSFVRDLPDDDKAAAVANAVLSLGHGLGLKVVAEGVETIEQFKFFQEAGCDLVQGFLFSRSLKPDEFVEWSKKTEKDFSFLG